MEKGREGEIHPILILYDDWTLEKSTLDIWIIYWIPYLESAKKCVELEDVSYLDFLYSLNISVDQRLTNNTSIVTMLIYSWYLLQYISDRGPSPEKREIPVWIF